MENLLALKGIAPRIHGSSCIDPTARVIGDVIIKEGPASGLDFRDIIHDLFVLPTCSMDIERVLRRIPT